jgi:cyclopropane-fatty-acyl-phospholipid synthase
LDDGSIHRFGAGAASERWQPRFTLIVSNQRGSDALASLDELRIGEAYLRGDLTADGDFMALLDLRRATTSRHPIRSMMRFLTPLVLGQRRSDTSWVPRHYDYGNEFYFTFLDKWAGMYSQALYTSEHETLETAVRQKLDYIVEMCRLRPGSHVLDVGAGWGAFEKYVGAMGVNVTMLTLSNEQYRHLSQWSMHHRLPCTLRVLQESIFSYRPSEQYDAIVLLGVMEHLPAYRKLFNQFERLLRPNGRLYMDFAAGRKKFDVGAFVYRYLFPGNHSQVFLPGLFDAANRTSFEPIALHNDRHSYYLTLQAWARNLEDAHDVIAARFGEQVYRLFRLYLWGGANMLERDGSLESYRVVFQKSLGLPSSGIGVYRAV